MTDISDIRLQGWQPMETAPKDGRLIALGWLPNHVLEHSVIARWVGEQWEWGWTPTHWRPHKIGAQQ